MAASQEKRPMKLCSSAFFYARGKYSDLADAPLHQARLDGERAVEGLVRPADHLVVVRPRLGRDAFVPDLAQVVAAPLDQMEGGLGGADGCDGGQRDGGSCAKGSQTTHEVSPVGKAMPARAAEGVRRWRPLVMLRT